MVAFYNQADQDIYTGGEHFIPQKQYRLNYTPSTTLASQIGNTGITNTRAAQTYPYPWPPQVGGGGGGGGGIDAYDPNQNLGTTNITDYEAEADDVGPTFRGTLAIAQDRLSKVPGLFSMARWAGKKFQDFQAKRAAKKEMDARTDAYTGPTDVTTRDPDIQATGPTYGPHGGQRDRGYGGFTDPGKGSYGPWKADGGIVGLAQGGRIGYNRGRVVNPGGYAGDEEGGILEWIKSKMGSESETNPTVFGTQNSLLNQGSIGQLQDAIKSYEALMMMGDLDEEQQDDYELKLNQLSALTEGATQKARGGRIGYRNGELVDENINVEGPGFDVNENVEMAEASPFEMRIQELMDEGMSWQEAYDIASDEFNQLSEGQEDSFSEEGIASIV